MKEIDDYSKYIFNSFHMVRPSCSLSLVLFHFLIIMTCAVLFQSLMLSTDIYFRLSTDLISDMAVVKKIATVIWGALCFPFLNLVL